MWSATGAFERASAKAKRAESQLRIKASAEERASAAEAKRRELESQLADSRLAEKGLRRVAADLRRRSEALAAQALATGLSVPEVAAHAASRHAGKRPRSAVPRSALEAERSQNGGARQRPHLAEREPGSQAQNSAASPRLSPSPAAGEAVPASLKERLETATQPPPPLTQVEAGAGQEASQSVLADLMQSQPDPTQCRDAFRGAASRPGQPRTTDQATVDLVSQSDDAGPQFAYTLAPAPGRHRADGPGNEGSAPGRAVAGRKRPRDCESDGPAAAAAEKARAPRPAPSAAAQGPMAHDELEEAANLLWDESEGQGGRVSGNSAKPAARRETAALVAAVAAQAAAARGRSSKQTDPPRAASQTQYLHLASALTDARGDFPERGGDRAREQWARVAPRPGLGRSKRRAFGIGASGAGLGPGAAPRPPGLSHTSSASSQPPSSIRSSAHGAGDDTTTLLSALASARAGASTHVRARDATGAPLYLRRGQHVSTKVAKAGGARKTALASASRRPLAQMRLSDAAWGKA